MLMRVILLAQITSSHTLSPVTLRLRLHIFCAYFRYSSLEAALVALVLEVVSRDE